jgi:exosortase D (VPLPA-CTERM-specific)
VLVEYWGIEQAEGFLHDFEGWIIFVGCLSVLFFEMWVIVKLFIRDKSFSEVFVVDGMIPVSEDENAFMESSYKDATLSAIAKHGTNDKLLGLPKSYIGACVLLLLVLPVTLFIGDREEISPQRTRFASFPLHLDDWKGVEVGMAQQFIDALKFDDYIIGNYAKNGDRLPVNFYVAYYASQRKGVSAHSPKSCMPGDGWRISDFDQRLIPTAVTAAGVPLQVNRTVISKGNQKQLVYYWFQQRGRIITNEYLVKWYLFWDALTRQRTDGALVRLVIALPEGMEVAEGDDKLEDFLKVAFPKLEKYVPS